MRTSTRPVTSLTTKLILGLIVLVCLALGAVGLILPLIPGLLFLAIAALIVSKQSPSFERWLRRNTAASQYLDRVEGFSDLDATTKVRLGLLMCAKALLDTLALTVAGIRRVLEPRRASR